jgi:hypothetical protein
VDDREQTDSEDDSGESSRRLETRERRTDCPVAAETDRQGDSRRDQQREVVQDGRERTTDERDPERGVLREALARTERDVGVVHVGIDPVPLAFVVADPRHLACVGSVRGRFARTDPPGGGFVHHSASIGTDDGESVGDESVTLATAGTEVLDQQDVATDAVGEPRIREGDDDGTASNVGRHVREAGGVGLSMAVAERRVDDSVEEVGVTSEAVTY